MTPATAITLTAASLLLLASTSASRSNIEAGEGGAWPSFNFDNLTDRAETLMNQITETPADVPVDVEAQNTNAFLAMIRQAKGTARSSNPYAVCYGYRHTIANFSSHPAITGEWRGERLSDSMCGNAGFGPGCVSSAAGAYQIIKLTWANIQSALGLSDFSPDNQDAAAVELIRRRGALQDVKAGRIEDAIRKCRNEWASLPGNYAKQGQRQVGDLVGWYQQNGGNTA